ncbi:unnamed protein product [Linum tenue]|uniref:Uncharacterized protein n=1 Tax=Linum tenue TaxID=586396 RepID=A0AAV0NYQ1_9ROSI|nr:unnamed protein product [Linum tenue]
MVYLDIQHVREHQWCFQSTLPVAAAASSPSSPTAPSSFDDDFLFAGIVAGVRHPCSQLLPLDKKKMKTISDLVGGRDKAAICGSA